MAAQLNNKRKHAKKKKKKLLSLIINGIFIRVHRVVSQPSTSCTWKVARLKIVLWAWSHAGDYIRVKPMTCSFSITIVERREDQTSSANSFLAPLSIPRRQREPRSHCLQGFSLPVIIAEVATFCLDGNSYLFIHLFVSFSLFSFFTRRPALAWLSHT